MASNFVRLSKFIAKQGICSRRQAEKMITEGLIKVNGLTALIPQTPVTDTDTILIHNKSISDFLSSGLLSKYNYSPPESGINKATLLTNTHLNTDSATKLWIYHKPRNSIVSYRDERNRTTIFSLMPKCLPRLIAVGRLDYNTEGLMLLTNNGHLARSLELPLNNIKRVYKCRCSRKITDKQIKSAANGIIIDNIKYRSVNISPINIKSDKNISNFWYQVTLTEGKNREIRKIFESFSTNISRLIRVQYDNIKLDSLPYNNIIEIDPSSLLIKYNHEL